MQIQFKLEMTAMEKQLQQEKEGKRGKHIKKSNAGSSKVSWRHNKDKMDNRYYWSLENNKILEREKTEDASSQF